MCVGTHMGVCLVTLKISNKRLTPTSTLIFGSSEDIYCIHLHRKKFGKPST